MEKKNSAAIVLAVVAVIIAIAAYNVKGNTTSMNQPPQDTLAKIEATKKMEVCYAVWPPAVIKDATTGALSGHDIDAMTELAQGLGATPEFHETTFGNMAAAIQSGICDVGTSLFVEIPRAGVVDFSRPILYSGVSGLVRKGDTRFATLADIDKPGVKIVVATGEAGDIYATANFKQATITRVDVESSDLSRFLLQVTSGQADIGIADANTIRLFAAAHPESTDAFANNPFGLAPDAFPMRLGDNNFINYINNSLLVMQTNGDWAALLQKYNAHWLQEVPTFRMN